MNRVTALAGVTIAGAVLALTGCSDSGAEHVPGHATVTVEYTTVDTGAGSETGTVTYDSDITCIYAEDYNGKGEDAVNYTDDPENEELGNRRSFLVHNDDGLIKSVTIPFEEDVEGDGAPLGAFTAAPLDDEAPVVSDDANPDITGLEGEFKTLSGSVGNAGTAMTATTGVVVESNITCQK